jgi:hypothetical protein
MLTGNQSFPRALNAMEGVEAIRRPDHRDRHVHYSHEMPDETAEASARILIRTVPLVYGVLLGGILGNMLLGIAMGLALSVALDMRMKSYSLSLPVLGPLLAPLCPVIRAVAHGLARLLKSLGLRAPAFLADMHCEVPKR